MPVSNLFFTSDPGISTFGGADSVTDCPEVTAAVQAYACWTRGEVLIRMPVEIGPGPVFTTLFLTVRFG